MLSSLRIKHRPNSERPTSFRSYVDLGLLDGKPKQQNKDEQLDEPIQLTPTMLPGEIEITQVANVLKFNTFSELRTGISGVLFCTNFKLAFVTAQGRPYSLHHQNFLLGENDICLINIDAIYQVGNGRRRKLLPGSNQIYPIEMIEVHCKDFRVLTFSFKFSPPNADRAFVTSLLHHAFTPKLNLLYIFDYLNSQPSESVKPPHHMKFTKASDWASELKRTGCRKGWRVTQVNEGFMLCKSLPEAFVVPAVLLDKDLSKAAPSFMGHRVLTWCWGTVTGQALVRMAALDPSIEDNQQLLKLQDTVMQTHPKKEAPKIVNLDAECGTFRDIQMGFLKLKELCMPASPQEFWEQDSTFYSSLENTHWLSFVSSCLQVSQELAKELDEGIASVILIENEGRDLSCVVSCLIQILLESNCRTQEGFESLIYKEWITLGHDFTSRLGHLRDTENEQAPLFLLFLDCVWQLTQQFPSAFEFSETYLTTLWDSTHISFFETFLFSCCQQHVDLFRSKNCFPPSVWDWSRQYSQQDMMLFRNPLYQLESHRELSNHAPRPLSLGANVPIRNNLSNMKKHESILDFDSSIMCLGLWRQCYMRWVPLCNIVGGGTAVLYLQNLSVAEDIRFLSMQVKSLVSQHSQQARLRHHRRSASDEISIGKSDARSFPQNTSLITSSFPFSSVGPSEWQNFKIPSSSYLCVSYGSLEESQDD